jgi:hypothetical protein
MRAMRLLVLSALAALPAAGQTPVPVPPTTPATTPVAPSSPPDDVRMIRYKISAGDLPSAESILETATIFWGSRGWRAAPR